MPSALKQFIKLMRETLKEWSDDGASRIAAALAYYTIFSLSPLLIFIAIVLGFAIDRQTLESNLIGGVETTVGSEGAQILRSLIANVTLDRSSIIGSIISLSIVIWGASNLFTQLQFALNRIWEVRVRPGSPPVGFIISRLESFGILGFAAFGLLSTTLINIALSRLINGGADPSALFGTALISVGMLPLPDGGVAALLIRPLQVLVSISLLTVIIAVIFRVLPDVVIHWKDVMIGSLFTAILLFIGQFLVGLYLSNSNVGSVFGAAGSLTAILVWIYYTAQILLFGAEFTEVWARNHGTTIRPNRYAIWINEFQARREAEQAGVDFEHISSRHAAEVQRQQEAWDAFKYKTKRAARRVAVEAADRARRGRNQSDTDDDRIEVVEIPPIGIETVDIDDEPEPPRSAANVPTQTAIPKPVLRSRPQTDTSTET